MEVKRTTAISRLNKITLRLPIENFTTREVRNDYDKYQESDNIGCFKEHVWCKFWIKFDSGSNFDRSEEIDLVYPRSYGFYIQGFSYDDEKAFCCKVWLENENGDKFWEDKCKLYFTS
jgi:hypothetical protein